MVLFIIMKKLIVTFIILLFSVSVVHATTAGMLECGKIVKYCNISNTNINCETQTAWVMGFISGVSTDSQNHLKKGFNEDNVKYALIKYCKENPFEDSFDAAYDIFFKIRK